MIRLAAALFALPLAATALPALAQQPAPVPAPRASEPVPADPAVTTASYGDWVLRCATLQVSGAPAPVRACEVGQAVQVEGSGRPILQLAIGKPLDGGALRVTAVLPAEIAIPGEVRLEAIATEGGAPLSRLDLAWTRCTGGACIADAAYAADTAAAWTAENGARLSFLDALGRNVSVPLSWRGFAQAFEALQREGG